MTVKEITQFDLLVTKCKCGYTNIHGYANQFPWEKVDNNHEKCKFICKACKCDLSRTYEIIYEENDLINGAGI